MTTHPSILAWRTPQTEEPGWLQFTELQRVRHEWINLAHTQAQLIYNVLVSEAPPCSSNGKESACNAGDQGSIPGSGRSTEEGNGNHPSILASRIPWTEKPGGLQFMGSQRVGHDGGTNTHTLVSDVHQSDLLIHLLNLFRLFSLTGH